MDNSRITAHNELPVDGEGSSGRRRMFEDLFPPMSPMEIRIGASEARLRHKMSRKDGLRQQNRNTRKTGRKINKTMYVGRGRPIHIPRMDPEAKYYMELNAKRRREREDAFSSLSALQVEHIEKTRELVSDAMKKAAVPPPPADHESADALYHELEHTWRFKMQ